MTHTPLMACDRGDYGDYDGDCVVILDEEMTRRIAVVFEDEDAAFIVKAVNNHDKLVEALKAAGEVVRVAQSMTGCRGDDDWIKSVQDQVSEALEGLE